MFYIIPTPIGNIEDITYRALSVLRDCDYLLCENTQTTQRLLIHFEIKKSCYKYTTHSTQTQEEKVINDLREGKVIGLVSEAGTPGISDPGNKIINKIIAEDLPITCLPGANAIISAILLSGFSSKEFTFLGFLPHKGRTKIYNDIVEGERNIIFYESIHRIMKTLSELSELIPDRSISISRELTKSHEETLRGTASTILAMNVVWKGEVVVCISSK